MNKVPLSKNKIESRLAMIREALVELQRFGKLSLEEFLGSKDHFAIAEHYLRRALEAVFDIGNHIISRYSYPPCKRPKSLKEIAIALGEKGIVDKIFARERLVAMAGFRNRMVHFYDELTEKELHQIITEDRGDFERFASSIVEVIKKPEKFGLQLAEF